MEKEQLLAEGRRICAEMEQLIQKYGVHFQQKEALKAVVDSFPARAARLAISLETKASPTKTQQRPQADGCTDTYLKLRDICLGKLSPFFPNLEKAETSGELFKDSVPEGISVEEDALYQFCTLIDEMAGCAEKLSVEHARGWAYIQQQKKGEIKIIIEKNASLYLYFNYIPKQLKKLQAVYDQLPAEVKHLASEVEVKYAILALSEEHIQQIKPLLASLDMDDAQMFMKGSIWVEGINVHEAFFKYKYRDKYMPIINVVGWLQSNSLFLDQVTPFSRKIAPILSDRYAVLELIKQGRESKNPEILEQAITKLKEWEVHNKEVLEELVKNTNPLELPHFVESILKFKKEAPTLLRELEGDKGVYLGLQPIHQTSYEHPMKGYWKDRIELQEIQEGAMKGKTVAVMRTSTYIESDDKLYALEGHEVADDKFNYTENSKKYPIAYSGDKQESAVHPNDVKQGILGDCFLLTGLISISAMQPDFFYNKTKPEEGAITCVFEKDKKEKVTPKVLYYEVKMYLPWRTDARELVIIQIPPRFIKGDDGFLYAKEGDHKELWVAIMERAMAEVKGGFNASNGGTSDEVFALLLPPEKQTKQIFNLSGDMGTDSKVVMNEVVQNTLKNKGYVVVSSKSQTELAAMPNYKLVQLPDNPDLICFERKANQTQKELRIYSSHGYSLLSANAPKYNLRNPFGTDHLWDIELDDILEFSTTITIVKPC